MLIQSTTALTPNRESQLFTRVSASPWLADMFCCLDVIAAEWLGDEGWDMHPETAFLIQKALIG